MIDNDQTLMPTCPICQGSLRKRRQWQEVCSPACRRKRWQINMVKKILKQAYEKPYAELYAELESKIKAGIKF